MFTTHEMRFRPALALRELRARSIHLVVTSPPYPMIEMWDASFSGQDPEIAACLSAGRGLDAFERMHRLLDPVWKQVRRVLVPGGIACINIGDATRTLDGGFCLYPNHARVLAALLKLEMTPLPLIIWRKQTNAPNKFMGSGMYPPGAYVTLEHEHVIIVRKGGKRLFETAASKANRRRSAYFWEERNRWFSDVWFDLKGATQILDGGKARDRSGAFPFELPYRLISMFSVLGDTVLDPFAGTGTTLLAAMTAARSCIGFEIDPGLAPAFEPRLEGLVGSARERMADRIERHVRFTEEKLAAGGPFGYPSKRYGFPVVTRQEVDLFLPPLLRVEALGEFRYRASHGDAAN